MAKYRLLEVTDPMGNTVWQIQKKILGLYWSEYFRDSNEWASVYREKQKALDMYNHYTGNSKARVKVIAEN